MRTTMEKSSGSGSGSGKGSTQISVLVHRLLQGDAAVAEFIQKTAAENQSFANELAAYSLRKKLVPLLLEYGSTPDPRFLAQHIQKQLSLSDAPDPCNALQVVATLALVKVAAMIEAVCAAIPMVVVLLEQAISNPSVFGAGRILGGVQIIEALSTHPGLSARIVNTGVLIPLRKLLALPQQEILYHVVVTIGNLADVDTARQRMFQLQILSHLTRVMVSDSIAAEIKERIVVASYCLCGAADSTQITDTATFPEILVYLALRAGPDATASSDALLSIHLLCEDSSLRPRLAQVKQLTDALQRGATSPDDGDLRRMCSHSLALLGVSTSTEQQTSDMRDDWLAEYQEPGRASIGSSGGSKRKRKGKKGSK